VGYIRFSFVCLRANPRVKLHQKHELEWNNGNFLPTVATPLYFLNL